MNRLAKSAATSVALAASFGPSLAVYASDLERFALNTRLVTADEPTSRPAQLEQLQVQVILEAQELGLIAPFQKALRERSAFTAKLDQKYHTLVQREMLTRLESDKQSGAWEGQEVGYQLNWNQIKNSKPGDLQTVKFWTDAESSECAKRLEAEHASGDQLLAFLFKKADEAGLSKTPPPHAREDLTAHQRTPYLVFVFGTFNQVARQAKDATTQPTT